MLWSYYYLRSRALHRVLSLAIQYAWCSYMLSRLNRKVKTFRSDLLTTGQKIGRTAFCLGKKLEGLCTKHVLHCLSLSFNYDLKHEYNYKVFCLCICSFMTQGLSQKCLGTYLICILRQGAQKPPDSTLMCWDCPNGLILWLATILIIESPQKGQLYGLFWNLSILAQKNSKIVTDGLARFHIKGNSMVFFETCQFWHEKRIAPKRAILCSGTKGLISQFLQ
jgi:hypothetical protein